ncbi:MAG: hypothetical protein FK730_14450 [Asgard group archaeon]|nr:hypothetical protein [Asgard group archaeon]
MPRFLTKIILTLEPTISQDKLHEEVREITAHHKKNFMKMIGVDPVVFRSNSSKGEVDLQIWITSVTGSLFNQLVLPFYFVGARKYIFMCVTKNSVHFVREVLEIVEEKINSLYEIMILTPANGKGKEYSKLKTRFQKLFADKNLENYSFNRWKSKEELADILKNVVEDIVVSIPQTIGYVPIGFDLKTVENIAKRQGFEVSASHEVQKRIDDVIFRVDLHNNLVFAEMTDCKDCPETCKAEKKLCVEIADKGFTTLKGLGDLRMLSVLSAIDDKSILKLKGTKPQEDINAQLTLLRKTFERNCKKKKKK